MEPSILEVVALCLLCAAVLHTFCASSFLKLEHKFPRHAGLWHLLGEVEVVFGLWALVFLVLMFSIEGKTSMTTYLNTRNYTEPMFVFVIMVIAASRPILTLVARLVRAVSSLLPVRMPVAYFFTILFLVPLLGSLMTEPAAMTLAALLLRDRFYSQGVSHRFMYATLGVLFVNISIGGILTSYAAPPVLMVASTWGFDTQFMLSVFGWKSILAVFVNALVLTMVFAKELNRLPDVVEGQHQPMPWAVMLLHVLFVLGVVYFAHDPVLFIVIFFVFLAYAHSYSCYQDRLIVKESLMVAVFLAGLVVLGGMQAWWLQDMLSSFSPSLLFFGSMVLTAVTDNAAITYMGSLVEGVNDVFKYALVSGAVSGGGLTVIANAPNPVGCAILKPHFPMGNIRASSLLVAAILPTCVAAIAFQCL